MLRSKVIDEKRSSHQKNAIEKIPLNTIIMYASSQALKHKCLPTTANVDTN